MSKLETIQELKKLSLRSTVQKLEARKEKLTQQIYVKERNALIPEAMEYAIKERTRLLTAEGVKRPLAALFSRKMDQLALERGVTGIVLKKKGRK